MSEANYPDINFLTETSRRNADLAVHLMEQDPVHLMEQDPVLYNKTVELFLTDDGITGRRAAWATDLYTERHPETSALIRDRILDQMLHFGHDARKRHAIKILLRAPLPEGDDLGRLTDICFTWMNSTGTAVAVKVWCMDLLFRITRREPGIAGELAESLRMRMDEESPGYRNHAGKILHRLRS